jgi:hypothetical protein
MLLNVLRLVHGRSLRLGKANVTINTAEHITILL